MNVIKLLILTIGLFVYQTSLFGQTVTLLTDDGQTAICKGTTVQLNLTIDPPRPRGDNSTWQVQWEKERNSQFIKNCQFPNDDDSCSFFREIPQETTTYTVIVRDGGNEVRSRTTITVDEAPNPGINTTIYLCGKTGIINLFDELDGGPDTGGSWSNGTGQYNTTDQSGGSFTYTVGGGAGSECPAISSIITVRSCGNSDSDGDGILDLVDTDKDNDGIPNAIEDGFCTPDSTTPIYILEEDFGFGGPTRSRYSEGLGLIYNPTLPQDTDNDGEYNVATSTYFGNASGSQQTFLSTDLIGDVDANGDIEGRYLAINMKSSQFADKPVFLAKDLPITPGVEHDFSMSIVSLNNNGGELSANLTIEVVDQATNTAIFSENSGEIANGTDRWILVEGSFVPDPLVTIVSIRVINKQRIDGRGNDIGIDNIFLSTRACDFDRDGIPNSEDLDADNDGIYDIVESGNAAADVNGDGRFDGTTDGNGASITVTYNDINSDADTNQNFLDIDADGDGIIDNIEGQSTAGYIAPSGVDGDFNGVDDAYDTNGTVIVPVNTSASGEPDYLSINSDTTSGDCLDDTVEAYDTDQDGIAEKIALSLDTDADGLDNAFDTVVLNRLSGTTNATNGGTLPTDFPNNHNPASAERDWREEFTLIDDNATIEGCSSSTASFDLFDELIDAAIPEGIWAGPAGSPPLTNGERGTFTPGTNDVGLYTYTLPAIGTCPARTGKVTVNSGALSNAGVDGTLSVCSSDENISLISSLTGSPEAGGSWTDPNGDVFGTDDQGTFNPSADASGTYTYTVGTASCQDTAVVNVSINAGADPGEDGSISVCSLDNDLNLYDSLGGTPAAGGIWSGPSGAIITNGDQGTIDPETAVSGDYVYTVTSTDCPTPATATVAVTIETTPTLTFQDTCAADRLSYDVVYITNGNWDITYTPNVGTLDAANFTISGIPADTNISITATNPANNACQVVLEVNAPNCSCPTDIPEPTNETVDGNDTICFGDPNNELRVGVSNGLSANWYDEDNQLVADNTLVYTPNATQSGDYTFFVEALDTNENCTSDKIQLLYTVVDIGFAEAEVNGKICVDQDGTPVASDAPVFIGVSLSTADYVFEWSFEGTTIAGEAEAELVTSQPGTYMVTYTDARSGCFGTASAVVETIVGIQAGDLSLSLSNNQFAANNAIIATVNGTGEYQYSLDGGRFQTNKVFNNVPLGTHQVVVQDINGCGTDEEEIKIFGFPKFFTPNGDAINDTWNVEIKGDEELPPMEINIFDRYGKLMKRQSPTDQGWDGTYNGNPLPSTDYWYAVQFLDGTGTEYRGHFNLRR